MTTFPFTTNFSGYASAIETDGSISIAYDELYEKAKHPTFINIKLTWDTGAVKSMISNKLVQSLGLQPIGMASNVNTHGIAFVNLYRVNLLLPNKMEIKLLEVLSDELPDADMLVGMDVINLCDFAISHPTGNTKMTLQIPSILDIDFTNAK